MHKETYLKTIAMYNELSGYAEQYFDEVIVPSLRKLQDYSETEFLGPRFNEKTVSFMYLRLCDNPEYNDLSFYKDIDTDEFLEYINKKKHVKK